MRPRKKARTTKAQTSKASTSKPRTTQAHEPFENEGMWYAVSRAWEAKTGKSTDDFYAIAPRVVRQLQGEPFDEETVDASYPTLAKKFGG